MIRRPPRSTLFPYRRSSDLKQRVAVGEDALVNRQLEPGLVDALENGDRKSTRLNSSHTVISYAVFCLKKKTKKAETENRSLNSKSTDDTTRSWDNTHASTRS